MKKIIALVLLAGALSFAFGARADDVFTYNLRSGMKADAQVTILQNLLISQNYLTGTPATGNFGPLTTHAVQLFQSENAIDTTGFVGPLTRARLNAVINGSSAGGVSFNPGCTSFAGFSTVTGKSCAVAAAPTIIVAPVSISNISANGASLSSSYQAVRNGTYTVRFEYALTQDAFTWGGAGSLGQTTVSGQASSFASSITNLVPNVTYLVRAVVTADGQVPVASPIVTFSTGTTGSNGSSYGGTVTGTYQNQTTALSGQAYVGTNAATSIGDVSAVLSGIFDGRGSATSVSFQYWNGTSGLSTTAPSSVGTGAGSVSFILSNLASSTTYSYRVVASNSAGTVYGNTLNFTTLQTPSNGGTGSGTTGGSTGGTTGSSGNSCITSFPHLTSSVASGSPSGTQVPGTQNSLLSVAVSTDCDASIKSLTFGTTNPSLSTSLTNFKVYQNGSSVAVAGTFANGVYTFSYYPVLLTANTTTTFTLKADVPTATYATASFSLTNLSAQSASGVTNQYPQSTMGGVINFRNTSSTTAAQQQNLQLQTQGGGGQAGTVN
jgi:hypothetical protein